jgi:hypothetical protein
VTREQEEKKREVIKHSAAIQIQNHITLLQRRTWNALLYHAYSELPTREEHQITLQALARLVGYDSHDMDYLKEASLAMLHCVLQWNILQKDGSTEWGATALLAQMKIYKGMCTYAYSPELRRRLYNPSMYARLDLDLQKRFESKYTLALWELCTDYLGAGRDYGETPFITVEQCKKLLGVHEGMYPLYKLFNQRVLAPALTEINLLSDFRVTVEYKRHGRKVLALKFKIRRVTALPAMPTLQSDLFPDLNDMHPALKLLKDAGLAAQDAWDVCQQGFAYVEDRHRPPQDEGDPQAAFTYYVREKIHLLRQQQQVGKVTSPTGFLLTALKKNYSNTTFTREEAAVTKRQHAKELQALRAELDALKHVEDNAVAACTRTLLEAQPHLLEPAFAALQQARNATFDFCYEADKTPQENMRRPALAHTVGKYLEAQFPDAYAAARAPVLQQRAALQARIAAREAAGPPASA